MNQGASFLREIGVKLAAEAVTREALIRELNSSSRTSMEEDGTPFIHASLTIYSQELTVFLGYDNKQLISDLTDWYDCRDKWTYRTKNMGSDEMVNIWVNLIGATTPELVQTALPKDAIGGGLASRMIFVYEDRKGKRVPAPFPTAKEISLRKDLLQDLEAIYTESGMVMVTEDFVEEWAQWYNRADEKPPFSDQHFAGYIERRPNHVLKLCVILAASANSRTEDELHLLVTKDVLFRAIDLLERTEIKMPRTFMGYGQSSIAVVITRMMAYIANSYHRSEGVTKMRLMQEFYADLGSEKNMDDAIDTLEGLGFCSRKMKDGKVFIVYNPKNKFSAKFGETG